MIAIVLGFITILGFLGVRSMESVKKDFRSELDRLIELRNQFENKMKDVDDQLLTNKKQFDELTIVSAKQDRRLDILETQEKANALMRLENYPRALEYINAGLRLEGNDTLCSQ